MNMLKRLVFKRVPLTDVEQRLAGEGAREENGSFGHLKAENHKNALKYAKSTLFSDKDPQQNQKVLPHKVSSLRFARKTKGYMATGRIGPQPHGYKFFPIPLCLATMHILNCCSKTRLSKTQTFWQNENTSVDVLITARAGLSTTP